VGRDSEGFLVVSDYDFYFMSDDHQDLSSVNTVTDDGVHIHTQKHLPGVRDTEEGRGQA